MAGMTKEKQHAYYEANKEKWKTTYADNYRNKHSPEKRKRTARNAYLRWAFGILKDEYDRLHEDQGGVCAVCGKPETSVWKGQVRCLAVDHDHETGRIRGLLCGKCNVALGLLGDGPVEKIRAMLTYLEQT